MKYTLHRVTACFMCLLIISISFLGGWTTTYGSEIKEVTIAVSNDNYPYYYLDENKTPQGLIIEFWDIWSQKTGVKVKYIASPWPQVLENVKEKKVDIVAGAFYSKERESYLDFGFPIVEAQANIFYHKSLKNISSLKDIKPYTVGVVKDDIALTYIKEYVSSASIRTYSSYTELIKGAAKGEVKAFVADTLSVKHLMERFMPQDPFLYDENSPVYTNYFYAAVPKGDRELLELINSNMSRITAKDREQILKKWLKDSYGSQKTVKIALAFDYPPLSYKNNLGDIQGFLVDLWKLWGQKTGVNVEFYTGSWKDSLKAVESGEADVHSGLYHTEERSRYLNFSQVFYSVNSKLFYNPIYSYVKNVEDLKGKNIAVARGSYQESFVKEQYPDLNLIEFDYSTSVMEALENNLVDGYMEEALTVQAQYEKEGKLLNLSIVPGIEFKKDMVAGVSKNNPELLQMVNEGLSKITTEEWIDMEERWVSQPENRYYSKPPEIQLTEEEKQWILQHPILKIAVDKNFRPVEYMEDNLHKGVSADYLEYIMSQLDIEAEVHFMSWPEVLKSLESGEMDASFNIQKTTDRSEYLNFSRPYIKIPHVIATNSDNKFINSLEDLSGLTVAVEEGYYKMEHFSRNPDIKILKVSSPLEALLAVSTGQADAYIGDKVTTAYYIGEKSLNNLRIREYNDLRSYNISVGAKKDLSTFIGLVNKVLDTMTDSEMRALTSRYSNLNEEGNVQISDAEMVWLRQHTPIRTGVLKNLVPIEFYSDNSQLMGITSDYASRYEKILSVQFDHIVASSYSEQLELLKSGKLDMITAAVRSQEQSQFMNFTKPYLISPMVILAKTNTKFVGDLDNVDEQKVGVIKDSYSEDTVKTNYPKISYRTYETEADAYKALDNRDIDLFMDSMVSVDYMTREMNITNVKIAGITDYKYEFCMGIRRDWPEMQALINRSFDSINSIEKNSIESYWINYKQPTTINISRYRNVIIGTLAVIILVLAVVIFWNRKLQKEINERKMVEVALTKAKEAADVASRSKTEFLANMSHEIRTPMNGVIGMTNLLANTELSSKQRDYVSKIIQAAYNLLNIINGILDFSKIEAGKMDLEEVDFKLETVLDNVTSIIGIRAKEKNIRLFINKESNVPSKLIGDPLRIEQILINLAGNAVKFTEEGEVEIRIHAINQMEDSVDLEICVRDTGIGMDQSQIEKLFKPFSQYDTSTTRKYGGTGLGLSITRKLIELMKGHIWAQCTLGGGCSFFFNISLKTAKSKEVQGETRKKLSKGQINKMFLKGYRFLVVEDNPMNQMLARELIKNAGGEVDVAEDGFEAIDILGKTDAHYDLIFMDLQMPDMDGFEATKKIRNMDRWGTVPIVAMTADVMTGVYEACIKSGMNDYVSKPISVDELYEKLSILLNINEPYYLTIEGKQGVFGLKSIDYEGAMKRLGGNQELYESLLRQFAIQYQNSRGDIKKLFQSADASAIKRYFHTLKGLAGNMGYQELEETSILIESLLKGEDHGDLEEVIEELIVGLESICTEIKEHL